VPRSEAHSSLPLQGMHCYLASQVRKRDSERSDDLPKVTELGGRERAV
jgi:hypothetical protein